MGRAFRRFSQVLEPMTFTTLAIIGMAAAGAWAAKETFTGTGGSGGRVRGNTAAEREALSAGNAEKAAQIGVTQAGGRPRPQGAPIVGQAVTRDEYKRLNTTPEAPPSTSELASGNMISAYAAGERARKRAQAGGSVLTGAQQGMAGPGGNYAAKTLLGS